MSPGEGAVTALEFFVPAGAYNPTHLLSGGAGGGALPGIPLEYLPEHLPGQLPGHLLGHQGWVHIVLRMCLRRLGQAAGGPTAVPQACNMLLASRSAFPGPGCASRVQRFAAGALAVMLLGAWPHIQCVLRLAPCGPCPQAPRTAASACGAWAAGGSA